MQHLSGQFSIFIVKRTNQKKVIKVIVLKLKRNRTIRIENFEIKLLPAICYK